MDVASERQKQKQRGRSCSEDRPLAFIRFSTALNLHRIEPERCHDDILSGALSDSSVVAEGGTARDRV